MSTSNEDEMIAGFKAIEALMGKGFLRDQALTYGNTQAANEFEELLKDDEETPPPTEK